LSVRSGKSSRSPVTTQPSIPLTRDALARLRLKALRRGVWFRDLKREERKLLELTIRVVEKVRSFLLAKIVSRIVSKLCEAMESVVYRLMRTKGLKMAEGLSEIAQSWGYRAAKSWGTDRGFMQFLVVTNLGVLGK